MPVILPPANHALWLDPELKDPEFLQALLTSVPDNALAAWEVGRAVNSPKNDGPELLEPAAPPRPAQASLL